MNTRLAILLTACAAVSAWALDGQVEVLSDRVNLRARPRENAEVAGQVNRGAILDVRGIDGDWVGVAAPTNVGLWVNTGFIQDNRVAADKLNVRAGAGINYPTVGLLPRDAPVQIRSQVGQWTEISPPVSAVLWVHQDFVRAIGVPTGTPMGPIEVATNAAVQAPSKAPVVAVEKPAETPEPVVEVPVTPAVPEIPVVAVEEGSAEEEGYDPNLPPALRGRELEGQAETMEREGSLLKTSFFDFTRLSNYCLVDWDRGRPVTVCYIYGNNPQLKTLEGRRFRISGLGYRVRGNAKPVIVAKQIKPLTTVGQ